MPDAKYFLADRRSPAFLRDFDGRVRECTIIARRTIRFGTDIADGWHVRVSPPLPLPTDDSVGLPDSSNVVLEVVLVASDDQDLDDWAMDQVNVIVYAVEADCLERETLVVEDGRHDVIRQYDAELAATRSHFADDGRLFYDGDIGHSYTREEYIEHVRSSLPDALRNAEEDGGPIEQWGNLQLEAFHYMYEWPRRERL